MTRTQFHHICNDGIKEAKQNLKGEELEKCITAIENFRRNYIEYYTYKPKGK